MEFVKSIQHIKDILIIKFLGSIRPVGISNALFSTAPSVYSQSMDEAVYSRDKSSWKISSDSRKAFDPESL